MQCISHKAFSSHCSAKIEEGGYVHMNHVDTRGVNAIHSQDKYCSLITNRLLDGSLQTLHLLVANAM